MKHIKKTLLLLGTLVVTGLVAQESPENGAHQNGGPRGPGHGPGGHHRPPPPVIVALDANRDGEIDPQEIANASNALLQLDTNGDGRLTFEELRPPCPPGGHPPQGGRPGKPGN